MAAQDHSAPSWEFLQVRWAELQHQESSAGGGARVAEEGAQLLRVISHAAEKFPATQAQQLVADLLKVGDGAGWQGSFTYGQRVAACCCHAVTAVLVC